MAIKKVAFEVDKITCFSKGWTLTVEGFGANSFDELIELAKDFKAKYANLAAEMADAECAGSCIPKNRARTGTSEL